MSISKYVFGAWCGLLAATAFAAVPNTFQAGTAAQAAQVNQNFQNLDARANASLGAYVTTKFTGFDNNGPGLAGAICPVNSLVVSASCECGNAGGTSNLGVLFACTVAGNGAQAACFNYLESPFLFHTTAQVTATCLSGISTDGTPWVPISLPLSVSPSGSSISAAGAPDSRRSISAVPGGSTEQQDEYNASLKRLQDALDNEARLKNLKSQ